MIILRPTNLHWINGSTDDSADLCAHSEVEFTIGKTKLVKPSDGDWTVSAAALYLLRTLSRPHTKKQPIAEHLFPCCGHGIFDVENQDDVVIVGCNSGMNFEVEQIGDEVLLTSENAEHRVSVVAWTRAVCEFSDVVQKFYASSSPKRPEDDFAVRSFQKFRSEWSRRRSLAEDHLKG